LWIDIVFSDFFWMVMEVFLLSTVPFPVTVRWEQPSVRRYGKEW